MQSARSVLLILSSMERGLLLVRQQFHRPPVPLFIFASAGTIRDRATIARIPRLHGRWATYW